MVHHIAADIAAVQRIDAVPRILEIVCRSKQSKSGPAAQRLEPSFHRRRDGDSNTRSLVPSGLSAFVPSGVSFSGNRMPDR
jgi:hypothetical protein